MRRKKLVHVEERKTRWALVAHKENIYSLIRNLQKIADHPHPMVLLLDDVATRQSYPACSTIILSEST